MAYKPRIIFICYESFFNVEVKQTACDDAGSMAERACFIIIAVCVERINAVELPHFAIKLVFDSIHTVKLDEYDNRLAGYIPTSDPDVDSRRQLCIERPFFQETFILDKIRRRFVLSPYIRTDKYYLFTCILFYKCCRFGRKHRVYTSHLIAYLPACFYEQVKLRCVIVHMVTLQYFRLQN